MTDKMVLYYQEQDKAKEQKEKEDADKKRKEKWETRLGKITDHLERYEKIYKYMVRGGLFWLIGTIIAIIAIILA